jgi:hypothetical protein
MLVILQYVTVASETGFCLELFERVNSATLPRLITHWMKTFLYQHYPKQGICGLHTKKAHCSYSGDATPSTSSYSTDLL